MILLLLLLLFLLLLPPIKRRANQRLTVRPVDFAALVQSCPSNIICGLPHAIHHLERHKAHVLLPAI
uniref:Putative secreted protein n=1 Tax=Anopheles darlingi TaxID=43151 RepID=A0A2M4D164_ANODA